LSVPIFPLYVPRLEKPCVPESQSVIFVPIVFPWFA